MLFQGVIGLFNCLRKEIGTDVIRGLLIQDSDAPKFSLQDPFYLQQIKKDLAVNVLKKNRVWGTYKHLPLPESKQELVPSASVNLMVHGDISSLNWLQTESDFSSKNDNLINIFYAAINFKYDFSVFCLKFFFMF